MGLDKPKPGHASVSKPRLTAMDHGEEAQGESDTIWQRQAREEMRALLQKEKEYRKNSHGRYLQKAAADTQKEFESRKSLLLDKCSGGSGCIDTPLHSTARPVIWGSALYRGLWAKAAKIEEAKAS